MRMNKKLVAITAGVAIVLAGGGLALAYWTTTGAGTGNGTVAASNGNIALHASFDNDLLAPGTSLPVSFTADNAGPSSLQVGTVTTVVSASGTCDASWFTVAPVSENQTIAGHGTAVPLSNKGSIVFADSALNQDSCKSATITLTLSSN